MCFVSFVQNYLFFCSGEEIHVTTHKVSTKTRHFYSYTQPHSFGDCSLQKSAKNSTYSHNKLRLFQVFFSFFLEIPWLGRGYTSFLSTEFPMTEYGSTRKKNTKNPKMIDFQTKIDELSITRIFTRLRSGWIIGAIGTRVYTSNLLHSIFSTKLNASSAKSQ